MTISEVQAGPAPRRVGVVVASFNEDITSKLLDGALQALGAVDSVEVIVARVPGALEIGVAAASMFEQGCDAVVAVGAVIKGETDHYEYVCTEVSRALTMVALEFRRPIGNAVLTVRDYEHAVDRSLPGPSNKGYEAAQAAIATARVLAGLRDRG